MPTKTSIPQPEMVSLAAQGVRAKRVHANLAPAELIEHAIRRAEGKLTDRGGFAAITAPHTGRSPKDKFLVDEPTSTRDIWWDRNDRISEPHFDGLLALAREHLSGQSELFVQDLFGGADPAYRLPVRFITPNAWQALFVRNMFIRPSLADLAELAPEWVVYHCPALEADPAAHGTRSGTFIVLNFARRAILIGGTQYAGEMKKSIFTVLNYLLPRRGVLSMHCSANLGAEGDTAIFFGLSGTGKTTLSADPARQLIGDDEHGWSDSGVFNFEGGCYAKVIRLSAEGEPEIYAATRMFGTVLENVVLDPVSHAPDFTSDRITENTRASYPIHFIPNHVPDGRGGHPKNVIFLTADAFGVLPPISKLTREQAAYHFISGYTAKLAGTEVGIKEPKATFSACFGAPFMPRHPGEYADMLMSHLEREAVPVWLVNTGWTGGPYGTGERMNIAHTRSIVRAALDGSLAKVAMRTDPVFGVEVPTSCPNVPDRFLDPRATWADPAAYDEMAARLARMFADNLEAFADGVSDAVRAAGPRVD